MKINVNQVLKSFDGKVIKDAGNDVMLSEVITRALIEPMKDESPNGNDSLRRHLLAQRVFEAKDDVEVSVEELSEIKNRVGSYFYAMISAPALLLIDPPSEK